MTVKKLKQVMETNLPALILMANAAGKTSDQDVAVWIIASSAHWRVKGYEKIREEMTKSEEADS